MTVVDGWAGGRKQGVGKERDMLRDPGFLDLTIELGNSSRVWEEGHEFSFGVEWET